MLRWVPRERQNGNCEFPPYRPRKRCTESDVVWLVEGEFAPPEGTTWANTGDNAGMRANMGLPRWKGRGIVRGVCGSERTLAVRCCTRGIQKIASTRGVSGKYTAPEPPSTGTCRASVPCEDTPTILRHGRACTTVTGRAHPDEAGRDRNDSQRFYLPPVGIIQHARA